jgi:hypothetical protein
VVYEPVLAAEVPAWQARQAVFERGKIEVVSHTIQTEPLAAVAAA